MKKSRLKTIRIEPSWCKGCGICAHFCPNQVLECHDTEKVCVARPQDCNCCGLCELRCPDLAIEVICEEQGDVDA